jgi:predicted DNA binding protein
MLRIEFQTSLAGISSRLFELEETVESVEIDNALPVTGDAVFLFITVQLDTDTSEERLSDQLPDVQIVDMAKAKVNGHTYHLGVIANLSEVSVLSLLTANQAIPHRIVGQETHLDVIASVRDWNHLKEIANDIEAEHGSLKLVGTTQTETIGFPLGGNKIKQSMSGKLSDEQLDVLEVAYQMGYFKVPQEVTAKEIANELEISRSTLSERLRRVEHNVCALLFGPQE